MTSPPPIGSATAMIVVTANQRWGAEVQGELLAMGLRGRTREVSLAAFRTARKVASRSIGTGATV